MGGVRVACCRRRLDVPVLPPACCWPHRSSCSLCRHLHADPDTAPLAALAHPSTLPLPASPLPCPGTSTTTQAWCPCWRPCAPAARSSSSPPTRSGARCCELPHCATLCSAIYIGGPGLCSRALRGACSLVVLAGVRAPPRVPRRPAARCSPPTATHWPAPARPWPPLGCPSPSSMQGLHARRDELVRGRGSEAASQGRCRLGPDPLATHARTPTTLPPRCMSFCLQGHLAPEGRRTQRRLAALLRLRACRGVLAWWPNGCAVAVLIGRLRCWRCDVPRHAAASLQAHAGAALSPPGRPARRWWWAAPSPASSPSGPTCLKCTRG